MEQFKTNVDAYNHIISEIHFKGYRQNIQCGSFANEKNTHRLQAKPLMIEILEPVNFLYLPKNITTGMIQKYYDTKIVGNERHPNEAYTYGERLLLQVEQVFEMLRKTPKTNQAIITIGQPSDIKLSDPPCLRDLVFSYFGNKLHLTSFWRSNDIGEAFLMNQGGLGLLLYDAANYAGLPMGSHFYCSPGAHIYQRN